MLVTVMEVYVLWELVTELANRRVCALQPGPCSLILEIAG